MLKVINIAIMALLFSVFFVLALAVYFIGFVLYAVAYVLLEGSDWVCDKLDYLSRKAVHIGQFWDRVLWKKLGLFQKGRELN